MKNARTAAAEIAADIIGLLSCFIAGGGIVVLTLLESAP